MGSVTNFVTILVGLVQLVAAIWAVSVLIHRLQKRLDNNTELTRKSAAELSTQVDTQFMRLQNFHAIRYREFTIQFSNQESRIKALEDQVDALRLVVEDLKEKIDVSSIN